MSVHRHVFSTGSNRVARHGFIDATSQNGSETLTCNITRQTRHDTPRSPTCAPPHRETSVEHCCQLCRPTCKTLRAHTDDHPHRDLTGVFLRYRYVQVTRPPTRTGIPQRPFTSMLRVSPASSGCVTQLFLQTTYPQPSQPAKASLAVFCLRMLARSSPVAWLEASAELQAVIAEFVLTHQHLPPTVWVTLPAAINISDISQPSLYLTDKQLQGAMQPKSALVVIFTAMLRRAGILCVGELQPAADEHLGKPVNSSDANATLSSMMLVLQVLLILSQKAGMGSYTAEATVTMSLVLSKLLLELPDMGEAATLLAAEPPGINPDLVLGLVQQLKQFLRLSIQFAHSSASLALDALSRLWFLALPKHGIPSEIIQEGQLLSSYCAYQP